MSARHARRDVLAERVRGVDVKRGTAGKLNRVFCFQFVELLEERFAYTYSLTFFGIVMQIRQSAAFRRCSK
jgi:hypothetical protein